MKEQVLLFEEGAGFVGGRDARPTPAKSAFHCVYEVDQTSVCGGTYVLCVYFFPSLSVLLSV